MSPHIDLLGRLSVGNRDDAACLDAVAERKRRKSVEEMQNTRITIRAVRIVEGCSCGLAALLFNSVSPEMRLLCLSSGREADVVRLRQPHELNAGRQDEERRNTIGYAGIPRTRTNGRITF